MCIDASGTRARDSLSWLWASRVSRVARLSAVTSIIAACGGGDGGGSGGITPPPNDTTVASVIVTPSTATLELLATTQLTALARTAAGVALNGKVSSWSSADPTIVSVTAAGVVTGVAVGSTAVSATIDGRSGSAQITVTPSTTQVIAAANVGPAGGTVSSPEIGLTVPAGVLTDTRRLEIKTGDGGVHPSPAYATGGQYRLSGFPTDKEVTISVRLKAPASPDGVNLIGYGRPVVTSNDTVTLSYRMVPARDSAGWIVANVTVRGHNDPVPPRAPGVTPIGVGAMPDYLDGYILGVKSADTLRTAHFDIVSYGAPRATQQPMMAPLLQYLEEAYAAVQSMGYNYAYRRTWPLPVQLHPMPDDPFTYAFFARDGAWPLGSESGWFEFNSAHSNLAAALPGVAIHEFFHFTQAQYGDGASRARFVSTGWLKEATASWIMEKAPSNLMVTKNTFFRGWRDSLFTGVHPGLNASGGYGKGALIKYVADTWGDGTIKTMFTRLGTGMSAEEAFVGALPVASSTFWPDFLTAYMENRVYSLNLNELVPASRTFLAPHPGPLYAQIANAYPVSARVFEFSFDTAKLSSGSHVKFRMRGGDSSSFKVQGFMATTSGWRSLGVAADTLLVRGDTLKKNKRIVVIAMRPEATAPFTATKWSNLYFEMGLQDGDWLPTNIRSIDDKIAYTSTSASDTTRIDVAENVTMIGRLLAAFGTWKRANTPTPEYTWTVYPEVADTLRQFGIVMSSTLKPVGADGTPWSYRLTSHFSIGATSARRAPLPDREASWWWYLLPIGLTPLLTRKRTRSAGALVIACITVGLAACDIGSISFGGKFAYEFELPESAVKFSASDADSTVPVLTYTNVAGKLVVEEYRSEYWSYVKNDQGEKVDSLRQVRTGAGTATFKFDGLLYHDNKMPSDTTDATIAAVARLLNVAPAAVRERAAPLMRRRR